MRTRSRARPPEEPREAIAAVLAPSTETDAPRTRVRSDWHRGPPSKLALRMIGSIETVAIESRLVPEGPERVP